MDDLMNMSTSSIAGVDLNDIEEFRNIPLPLGYFIFEMTGMELTEPREVNTERGDFNIQDVIAKTKVAAVVGDQKYKSADFDTYMQDINDAAVIDACVDQAFTEKFGINLSDPKKRKEGLGRIKAFLNDIGYEGPLVLDELDAAVRGIKFVAKVKGRKNNQNGAVYCQFDLNKVQAYGG